MRVPPGAQDIKGYCGDGWYVVTTAEITIDGDNTFERYDCECCGVTQYRPHDAEAFRKEQQA